MKNYSWKATCFQADAQLVGEELEEIERQGEVTKEHILEYAQRHKDSELYKCFEWDDTEAGRKYRLQQANTILCSISIEIKEEPVRKQRVYVSVKSSNSGDRVFKNIKDVLEDDEEYKQLVDKARREFENCKEKYEELINREDLKNLLFEIYKEV